MRKLAMLLAALSMTACTTNGQYDAGKTWLLVGAVVVGGVVASNGSDSPVGEKERGCNITGNSDGTVGCN